MFRPIEIVLGDITKQRVDAIVNAANNELQGGRGVDGAIHRAAGPRLLAACQELGGCPTGRARITPGYNLPARWVIHTVGPVYRDGHHGEEQLLESCYVNALSLASLYDVRTIAFPSISTGVYGYPLDRAARIAVRSVDSFLRRDASIERVILVSFSDDAMHAHQRALAEIDGGM